VNWYLIAYLSFLLVLLAGIVPLFPNADVLNARICAFYVDTCYLLGCYVDTPSFCAYGDGLAKASGDSGHVVRTLSEAESSTFGTVFSYAHWPDGD